MILTSSARRIQQVIGFVLLTMAFSQTYIQAQYSPKCRLNGQVIFCAITGYGTTPDGWQRTTVVLSDDRMIKLHYDDKSCKLEKGEQICQARVTISDRNGPRSAYGTYRLQRFEGGVTHRYQTSTIDLQFFYMD